MGIMRHLSVRVSAALFGIAVAFGIGCSSPGRQEKEQEQPREEGAKPGAAAPQERPAAVTPEGEKKPFTVQAQNPEFEKIAQELARGRTVQEQQQVATSQAHYELALRYHDKGEF